MIYPKGKIFPAKEFYSIMNIRNFNDGEEINIKTNNMVLNRLFTQKVLSDLLKYNYNSVYNAIVGKYTHNAANKKNNELISEIYNFMSKSYRNEYFFQNTLLNKLLIGKYSLSTTTALTQISIGKSKADFILINGKAVVYEIKSELDSFERLSTQLRDYFKAFNHVCVVTSEQNYGRLYKLLENTPVGIYVITSDDTISSKLRKEPIEDNSHLDYLSIFKLLRKREFESILKGYYGDLPITSQVFYYDECYSQFEKIPLGEAYDLVLKELKNRNKTTEKELRQVPYELRSLLYFSSVNNKVFHNLNHFLNQEYRG